MLVRCVFSSLPDHTSAGVPERISGLLQGSAGVSNGLLTCSKRAFKTFKVGSVRLVMLGHGWYNLVHVMLVSNWIPFPCNAWDDAKRLKSVAKYFKIIALKDKYGKEIEIMIYIHLNIYYISSWNMFFIYLPDKKIFIKNNIYIYIVLNLYFYFYFLFRILLLILPRPIYLLIPPKIYLFLNFILKSAIYI